MFSNQSKCNLFQLNKIALVTGASSGIGEAISRELVKRGWTVIGVARSENKLAQIQKELSNSFVPMICDVSKNESIEKTSKQILQKSCLFCIESSS